MTQNVIFQILGGLGKSILSTAVLKVIKKSFPKANIIVITHYTDVFVNNPNVNLVLNPIQANGLYKKYIENRDTKVFVSDPYNQSDYITESKHLLEIWCEMYGLEYNNEQPEIFLSKGEKEYFSPFYKLEKPIMAIQPNGGGADQPLKYSWTRDIPSTVVNDVINYFKSEYAILHIKREDQIIYENTIGALDSWRSIAIMLSMSKKRLLIDSSSMHISTALNLPSVVTWVGTNPNVFGSEIHNNIVANSPTKIINLENNYFSKHLLFEDLSTFPYENLTEVFDSEKIIEALKNQ